MRCNGRIPIELTCVQFNDSGATFGKSLRAGSQPVTCILWRKGVCLLLPINVVMERV
jgi:hypothetical protein